MTLPFIKYQGAGNDFVMIDQRRRTWLHRSDTDRIQHLCDRHFGIGADGLILLQECEGYDFEMIYFNSDGRESTMCGNGGRCIAAFAHELGLPGIHYHFLAIDGPHEAHVKPEATGAYWVELKMGDVPNATHRQQDFVLNTGSPHYVRFVPAVQALDMVSEGRSVRYSADFREAGINVNMVQEATDRLLIRTYERGVEDETLACGTGVTAAALAFAIRKGLPSGDAEVPVEARGGHLAVRFHLAPDGSFSNIWLCGPAKHVFQGQVEL